jgi:peptide/nickel transport system permease protein
MLRWRSYFRRRQNLVGLIIVAAFIAVAAAAPWLAPVDDPNFPSPFKSTGQFLDRQPRPPSSKNPLGTIPQIQMLPRVGIAPGQDAAYQWDVLHTLIWGVRSALRFGLTVTFLTAFLGVLLGAVSGYLGGWSDRLLMRTTDAFLAFPSIAAVWLLEQAIFSKLVSPFGLPVELNMWQQLLVDLEIDSVMVALILFSWMPYARLTNAMVVRLKRADYVIAAQAMGARGWRIIWHHLLPNAIGPAVVLAARDVGGMVITACAFIFIGIGGYVPWGIMLVSGRDYVIGLGGNPFAYWWTFVPISLALILFGIGWNLLGDGLNTLLNPRSAP